MRKSHMRVQRAPQQSRPVPRLFDVVRRLEALEFTLVRSQLARRRRAFHWAAELRPLEVGLMRNLSDGLEHRLRVIALSHGRDAVAGPIDFLQAVSLEVFQSASFDVLLLWVYQRLDDVGLQSREAALALFGSAAHVNGLLSGLPEFRFHSPGCLELWLRCVEASLQGDLGLRFLLSVIWALVHTREPDAAALGFPEHIFLEFLHRVIIEQVSRFAHPRLEAALTVLVLTERLNRTSFFHVLRLTRPKNLNVLFIDIELLLNI